MSNPQNTRAVAWLMLSILLVLLSYPLSFGPACWLADRGVVPIDAVFKGYAPIISAMREVKPVRSVFLWYAKSGSQNGSLISLILLITLSTQGDSGWNP